MAANVWQSLFKYLYIQGCFSSWRCLTTKGSSFFLWLQVFSLVLLRTVEEEEGEGEPKAQAVTCHSTSPTHPTSWSRHPRSVAQASQWRHMDISGCGCWVDVLWFCRMWNVLGLWCLDLDFSPALLLLEGVLQQEGCIQLVVQEHPV